MFLDKYGALADLTARELLQGFNDVDSVDSIVPFDGLSH